MKIDIKQRFTGAVKFTTEIEAPEDAPASVKMRLAVLGAIENKVDLSRSDLRGCDLRGSYLSGSDLSRSNLSGSDLSDCDLSGSNLRGCDLRDCDLRGSNLRDCDLSDCDLSRSNLRVLQTDIWTVYVQKNTIRIGCQYHSISDWAQFTDGQIANMHGSALIWWKTWKDLIFATHATI